MRCLNLLICLVPFVQLRNVKPKHHIMEIEIITSKELQEFKCTLIEEIKQLLTNQSSHATRRWLKTKEVLKALNISPGTLQQMRSNGTLPYSKIGGVIYYDSDQINKMIQNHSEN